MKLKKGCRVRVTFDAVRLKLVRRGRRKIVGTVRYHSRITGKNDVEWDDGETGIFHNMWLEVAL